ncbi:hypothetical protein ACUR5C_01480 [Aliikangiella sp. IMCC44653]
MKIDKITAKVRPRKSWEAIDLGVALVQQHAKALYSIWLIITLPAFLLLCLLQAYYGWYALFLFWWLKPLWERPMLHYLSRHLFDERLTVLDCVKAFFSLAKKQAFTSLIWRRLSPTRSLDLPVVQLENLAGSKRSSRLRTIHSIGSSSAMWITLFFCHLEAIIFAACMALLFLLIPAVYLEKIDFLSLFIGDNISLIYVMAFNFLVYLGMTLVAPFYTACGFSLYLNHRTLLEAWDIELTFKRLMKRLSTSSLAASLRLLSLLALIGISTLQTPLVIAQEPQSDRSTQLSQESVAEKNSDLNTASNSVNNGHVKTITKESVTKAINQIKNGESFKQTKTVNYLEYLGESDSAREDDIATDYSGYELIGKLFSMVVRFGLWFLLALVVIFLIVKYRHIISGVQPSKQSITKKPSRLFGLDVTQASLPSQHWLVAEELINAGNIRSAVSLLYRATLVWVIENKSITIKPSFTELECLAAIAKLKKNTVENSGEALSIELNQFQLITQLTYVWRETAYAHKDTPKQQLIDICHLWPKTFTKPAVTKSASTSLNTSASL